MGKSYLCYDQIFGRCIRGGSRVINTMKDPEVGSEAQGLARGVRSLFLVPE